MPTGPTPILATHRLAIQIGVPGIRAHNLRVFCNAVTDTSDPDLFDFVGIGTNVPMSTAVGSLYTSLRTLYPNSVDIGGISLERYDSGAWIPVGGDPSSGIGTASGAFQEATQISVTGRNSVGAQHRFQVMETVFAAPIRWTDIPSIASPLEALVLSLYSRSTTDFGYWMRYRDGSLLGLSTFISATITLNKRLRRDRGLV